MLRNYHKKILKHPLKRLNTFDFESFGKCRKKIPMIVVKILFQKLNSFEFVNTIDSQYHNDDTDDSKLLVNNSNLIKEDYV